ncbi:hypothetical protein BDV29DRAFT_132724 [Aspergillus leporis]|uniref:Secreted protein n=1 Tax=Aspergillus leporis TaxID=41062 RepID=A0A5N5X2W1_9EURO|nr:hypothetical protein BDV29DRAFT_132724 [Aspergillus leporis]
MFLMYRVLVCFSFSLSFSCFHTPNFLYAFDLRAVSVVYVFTNRLKCYKLNRREAHGCLHITICSQMSAYLNCQDTARHSKAQQSTAKHSKAQQSTAKHSKAQQSTATVSNHTIP